MATRRSTRRTALSLLAVGGYLLGSGTCVTREGAADFAESTASRLATLFVDALVINPLQDALTPSTKTQ